MAVQIIAQIVELYTFLIVAYVLLSWFPVSGFFADIYRVLASLVEPYLGLFRRIIPPLGMIDISPIIAILVLNAVVRVLFGLL